MRLGRNGFCLQVLALGYFSGCGTPGVESTEDNAPQQAASLNISAPSHSMKVIDGTLDDGTYPAVGMVVRYTLAGRLMTSCTGTLIAPDVVLTAKHCLPGHIEFDNGRSTEAEPQGPAPEDLMFVLGANPLPVMKSAAYAIRHVSYPLAERPELIQRLMYVPLFNRAPMTIEERRLLEHVDKICGSDVAKLHAQQRLRCIASLPKDLLRELGVFDEHSDTHDVALLFLSRPVMDVAPMRLFAGDLKDVQFRTLFTGDAQAESVRAVGYGLHLRPPHPFVPIQALRRRSGRGMLTCVGDYMFQLEQKKSICLGDSGGPVIFHAHDGMSVIGITSTADGRSENFCRRGNLFMRMDSYVEWVDAAMQRGCETGGRLPECCGR